VEAGAFGWRVGKAAHNHSHHSHARACWDAATRRPCAQRYQLRQRQYGVQIEMKYAMSILIAILLALGAFSFVEIHKGNNRIEKLLDLCNQSEKFESKQELVQAAVVGELDIFPIQGNSISVGASNYLKYCTCRLTVDDLEKISFESYACN
jgi:hypothetical protein